MNEQQKPVIVIDEDDATRFENRCAKLLAEGYVMIDAHASSTGAEFNYSPILLAIYALPYSISPRGKTFELFGKAK